MADQIVLLAQESIAKGSKSFAMAARLLRRAMREDCVLLYAWCRYADDVIDGQDAGFAAAAPSDDGPARLALLRAQTHHALDGGQAAGVHAGLARVVARCDIPHRHVDELLDGFAMDVAGRRYDTMGDLLDYCYHVAGVVGVMMARIMGVRDPRVLDRASDLGIAFQLTNIARDVIDDARIGRCYLPHDLLAAQGLSRVDPDDPAAREALHKAALSLLDMAEHYYASAEEGIAVLPGRAGLAIAAAKEIYRRIGVKLRARGPIAWESRVATNKWEKLAVIVDALARKSVGGRRRTGLPISRAGLYQRP